MWTEILYHDIWIGRDDTDNRQLKRTCFRLVFIEVTVKSIPLSSFAIHDREWKRFNFAVWKTSWSVCRTIAVALGGGKSEYFRKYGVTGTRVAPSKCDRIYSIVLENRNRSCLRSVENCVRPGRCWYGKKKISEKQKKKHSELRSINYNNNGRRLRPGNGGHYPGGDDSSTYDLHFCLKSHLRAIVLSLRARVRIEFDWNFRRVLSRIFRSAIAMDRRLNGKLLFRLFSEHVESFDNTYVRSLRSEPGRRVF